MLSRLLEPQLIIAGSNHTSASTIICTVGNLYGNMQHMAVNKGGLEKAIEIVEKPT